MTEPVTTDRRSKAKDRFDLVVVKRGTATIGDVVGSLEAGADIESFIEIDGSRVAAALQVSAAATRVPGYRLSKKVKSLPIRIKVMRKSGFVLLEVETEAGKSSATASEVEGFAVLNDLAVTIDKLARSQSAFRAELLAEIASGERQMRKAVR